MAFKMEGIDQNVLKTYESIFTQSDMLQGKLRDMPGYLNTDTLLIVPVGRDGDPQKSYGDVFLGITKIGGRPHIIGYKITTHGLQKITYEKIGSVNSSEESPNKIQFPGKFYQSGLLKDLGFTRAELNDLYTDGLIPPEADILSVLGIGYTEKSKHQWFDNKHIGAPATTRAIANKRRREQNRADLGYNRPDRKRIFYDPDARTFIPGRSIETEEVEPDTGKANAYFKTHHLPILVASEETDKITDPEDTVYHKLRDWTGDAQIIPEELKREK